LGAQITHKWKTVVITKLLVAQITHKRKTKELLGQKSAVNL
jgi:hypothetical protein